MKSFFEKSFILIVAVAVNLGLYLLVPYIQVLAARGAAKPPKSGKVVEATLAFEAPRRDQLQKHELKPIKTETYRPPSMATRPSIPGGGLKIDLSAAGGEGPALLSGGDLRGKIGAGTGGGEGSGVAAMTYDPGQTDIDAKPIGADPAPGYPQRAQRELVSGIVDITFIVNESGFPEQFQVIKEDPTGYGFGVAAIEAAKKIRFKPAMLQKIPVRQRFKKRYNFEQQ
jgi:TonB family protein